jgi:antitoxin component YwqK of YwqJK toxin-antitoxin module
MEKYVKNYYEESKQVKSEGILKKDKKEGVWKWYYPDGKLKIEGVYGEDQGNGHFYFYDEEGEETCNGIYKNDEREDKWVWSDKGVVTHIINYQNGKKHGVEQKYSGDGTQLLYEKNWKNEKLHGNLERYDEDGSPLEKATYVDDFLDQEHIQWENGKQKKKKYDRGVPILTEKRWLSLARQIGKKDESYQQMNIIEKAVGWHGSSARAICYMIREGFLDLNEVFMILPEIQDDHDYFSIEDFIRILKSLTLKKKQLKRVSLLFGFWPRGLDKMCMERYAQYPEVFEANFEDFSPNVKLGIIAVKIRFGTAVKEDLKKDMAADIAYRHVNNYGFNAIYWQKEGKVFELDLETDLSESKNNEEAFYEMIETFTTKEEWKQALLQTVLNMERDNLNAFLAGDAIKIASTTQFTKIFEFFPNSSFKEMYWALIDLREDTVEDLEMMAKALKEEYYIGPKSETLITVAILRRKADGLDIPNWYDEYIEFISFYKYIYFEGIEFAGIEYVEEALGYLPENRLEPLFRKQLKQGEWIRVFPLLHLLTNKDIWDEAINLLLTKEKYDHTKFIISCGLGRMKQKGMNWLVEKIDACKKEELRELLVLAIISCMANMVDDGELWEEKYDQFLQLYDGEKQSDYSEASPFFKKALNALPESRKNEVLLSVIHTNSSKPAFLRVFDLFEENIPSHIVEKALDVIVLQPVEDIDYSNWLEEALRGSLKERAEQFARYALSKGAKGNVLDWIRRGIGNNEMAALQAEIGTGNDSTVEVAKKKTKVELLQTKIQKYLEANPSKQTTTIYWLQKNKEETEEAQNYNRIAGPAFGVDAKSIPMYDEEYMDHILSLDLRSMPLLAASFPEDVKVISLYVANPDVNSAYTVDTNETRILELREEDLKKGVFEAEEYEPYDAVVTMHIVELKVPTAIFAADVTNEDIRGIKNDLFNAPGYVLGEPIWIQEEVYCDYFIMQFSEGLVDINLGDSGTMYVFKDTAFWQCY